MSYDDLHTYTLEFLEILAANEEDGRLTKQNLERLKSKGYLENVKTIYGKALATAMTGELDHIPFNIGTPAGKKYVKNFNLCLITAIIVTPTKIIRASVKVTMICDVKV